MFEVKAFWVRMIFTGRGAPPTAFKSSNELKKWVSENTEGIGYIDLADVDDSVKVILVVR
ncbi:MAG: hypothetical protein JKY67_13240 [Pseudomonadales bacterium]|nr:hypothetical protein [Pseudomonadales bacterium]